MKNVDKVFVQIEKKIIPCIFQQVYNNIDGWLDFIIGDKIFVDFTKYSYEEALKRLKKQLNLLIKSKEISEVVVTEKAEKEIHSKSKQIETWSETEVLHCFIEKKILSNIYMIITMYR